MFKKILVGLDGSPLAEASLPYAETLARASNASITVLRVVAENRPAEANDEDSSLRSLRITYPTGPAPKETVSARAERHGPVAYVDSVVERLGQRGVVAEAVVARGRPEELLVSEARARHADLIIVTTHGRSGLGRWVYGSVAEAVLARSQVPVLIVRAWPPPHALVPVQGRPRIVVPLDGSPFSEGALPCAGGLARLLGAELCLTHVVSVPRAPVDTEGMMIPEIDPDLENRLEHEAREYLATVQQRLQAEGLRGITSTSFGSPGSGIVETAREYEAGLIVMATHGRTGLARTLLGSTALEVLHRGNLPVLFVQSAPLSESA